MQLNVRFKGMESTEALKDYFEDRFKKLHKHVPVNTVVNVSLAKAKLDGEAEVSFNFAGKSIVATERSEDLYAAIDAVVDKVTRQVTRARDRQRNRGGGVKHIAEAE